MTHHENASGRLVRQGDVLDWLGEVVAEKVVVVDVSQVDAQWLRVFVVDEALGTLVLWLRFQHRPDPMQLPINPTSTFIKGALFQIIKRRIQRQQIVLILDHSLEPIRSFLVRLLGCQVEHFVDQACFVRGVPRGGGQGRID